MTQANEARTELAENANSPMAGFATLIGLALIFAISGIAAVAMTPAQGGCDGDKRE